MQEEFFFRRCSTAHLTAPLLCRPPLTAMTVDSLPTARDVDGAWVANMMGNCISRWNELLKKRSYLRYKQQCFYILVKFIVLTANYQTTMIW